MARKAHVFISFKTEERELAFSLRQRINEAGFKVWWQEDLQCGQEWHGEIDKAIEEAGAIVVLWSAKSITSPWVRHEASQAISKKLYAPVRVEMVDIGSPFDRIQATDLINWDRRSVTPALTNLLKRLEELLPKPIPLWKQYFNSLKRNWITITSIFVATGSLLLLWVVKFQISKQNDSFHSQIEIQKKISGDLQRALQPIGDFNVSVELQLDSANPDLISYMKFLDTSLKNVTPIPFKKLPPGITFYGFDGYDYDITIPRTSSFWPQAGGLSNNVNSPALFLEFNLPTRERGKKLSAPSDLIVTAEPNDAYWADSTLEHVLRWNRRRNSLKLVLQNLPCRPTRSNGKILSIVDLQTTAFTIWCKANLTMTYYTGNSFVTTPVFEIEEVDVAFAGRNLSFYGKEMKRKIVKVSYLYSTFFSKDHSGIPWK